MPTRADGGMEIAALVDRLRAAAAEATPGEWFTTGEPWFISGDGVLAGSPDGNVGFMIADCAPFAEDRDSYEGHLTLASADADATHIAAACPANVLAILDHLAAETARADREAARADAAERERAEALSEHTDMMWQRRRADERADAAEARVRELEEALSPFQVAWDQACTLAVSGLRHHGLEAIPDRYMAYVATARGGHGDDQAWPLFRFGDLRRAARLLAHRHDEVEHG